MVLEGEVRVTARSAGVGIVINAGGETVAYSIAKERALPFEPFVPNDDTIAAMKAARNGKLVKAGTPDSLLEKLNAGD